MIIDVLMVLGALIAFPFSILACLVINERWQDNAQYRAQHRSLMRMVKKNDSVGSAVRCAILRVLAEEGQDPRKP